MRSRYVTDLPLGYDERTQMALGPQNQVVIAHPLLPPMVYDEQVMRWVELAPAVPFAKQPEENL